MTTSSNADRQKEHLTHTNGFKFQAYHHEAVELRYQGKTYLEIATNIAVKYKRDFKESTVRAWFGRGRILDQPYLDYARQENERRRQATREELKKLVTVLPVTFEKLIRQRFIRNKEGAVITDDAGQPLEKLDMVTVAAIDKLCKILGIADDANKTGDDPTDRYFDKLETEIDGHETDPAPQ